MYGWNLIPVSNLLSIGVEQVLSFFRLESELYKRVCFVGLVSG